MKGQRSRRGDHRMPGFEGGQTPLMRRIPKRGFRQTAFQIPHEVINLASLEKYFDDKAVVTSAELKRVGLIKAVTRVKILGDGSLTKALTVEAWAFSKSAAEKIQKAGGNIKKIPTSPVWQRSQEPKS
jgi:large subunit ribosomal protein L15